MAFVVCAAGAAAVAAGAPQRRRVGRCDAACRTASVLRAARSAGALCARHAARRVRRRAVLRASHPPTPLGDDGSGAERAGGGSACDGAPGRSASAGPRTPPRTEYATAPPRATRRVALSVVAATVSAALVATALAAGRAQPVLAQGAPPVSAATALLNAAARGGGRAGGQTPADGAPALGATAARFIEARPGSLAALMSWLTRVFAGPAHRVFAVLLAPLLPHTTAARHGVTLTIVIRELFVTLFFAIAFLAPALGVQAYGLVLRWFVEGGLQSRSGRAGAQAGQQQQQQQQQQQEAGHTPPGRLQRESAAASSQSDAARAPSRTQTLDDLTSVTRRATLPVLRIGTLGLLAIRFAYLRLGWPAATIATIGRFALVALATAYCWWWRDAYVCNVLAQRRERGTLERARIVTANKVSQLVIVVGCVCALRWAGLRINLRPLLSTAGFFGIVTGYVARDVLSNAFGGLVLSLSNFFAIGDSIRTHDGSCHGTVTKLGWFATELLQASNGRPLYVPNARLTNCVIENASRARESPFVYAFSVQLRRRHSGERNGAADGDRCGRLERCRREEALAMQRVAGLCADMRAYLGASEMVCGDNELAARNEGGPLVFVDGVDSVGGTAHITVNATVKCGRRADLVRVQQQLLLDLAEMVRAYHDAEGVGAGASTAAGA